jgi:hypothetical protein
MFFRQTLKYTSETLTGVFIGTLPASIGTEVYVTVLPLGCAIGQ